HISESPHQFQCRRLVSMVRLLKMTLLTVAPSCTFIPKPLLELRSTQLLNTTCRISASVSVPIISGVEDDDNTQLVTVTFSTGLAFLPSRAMAFSTMQSSPVMITESEMVTFREEQISIPSAFTPFSRSE